MENIKKAKYNIEDFPFDINHILLAKKSIKAIYDSNNFKKSDFQELYDLNWNDSDIFTSIEHIGFMLKNSRIIAAYLDK